MLLSTLQWGAGIRGSGGLRVNLIGGGVRVWRIQEYRQEGSSGNNCDLLRLQLSLPEGETEAQSCGDTWLSPKPS